MVGKSPVYSDDRRVTGDWVEQYADIVARPLLPERWPWAIAIDELEIRFRARSVGGLALLSLRLASGGARSALATTRRAQD
jgi:hypothetical protein